MIIVRVDDPTSPPAAAMIERHSEASQANTPPGFRFMLDPAKLAEPNITFFTAWDGDALVGMGALKVMSSGHAEVKSMRTEPAHRRKGIGAAILARIVVAARDAGLTQLSLETGTDDGFAPARALYRRAGFVDCAAFAPYPEDSPHNCYMTLAL